MTLLLLPVAFSVRKIIGFFVINFSCVWRLMINEKNFISRNAAPSCVAVNNQTVSIMVFHIRQASGITNSQLILFKAFMISYI